MKTVSKILTPLAAVCMLVSSVSASAAQTASITPSFVQTVDTREGNDLLGAPLFLLILGGLAVTVGVIAVATAGEDRSDD